MAENTIETLLIKVGTSILNYLASNADDQATSYIDAYWREKRISNLEAAIHKELENMASDSVVLEAVEASLSKKGLSIGSQTSYDWSLMAKTTERIVQDFFSHHPEWCHNQDDIASMIKRVITETYNAVLSFLDPNARILFIQEQRDNENILQAIKSLHKKIVDEFTEWNKNKLIFNPDVYEAYLNKYEEKKISHRYFQVKRDGEKYSPEDAEICKDELFSELERFLSYSWRMQVREKLNGYEKDFPVIVNFLYNIDHSFSMSRTIQQMKKMVGDHIKARPNEEKSLKSILKKLINTPFQNCLFISGCYGCGKTRTSFELAKHVQSNKTQFGDTVFLFVSSDQNANICDNIKMEFAKLFPKRNSIDQYLDAFSENLKLVIVLDDVQRYFQKGANLDQIFNLVEEYSRSYVKWIIMTQPGYCRDPYDLYGRFHEEYTFQWSDEMNRHVIDKWFALDSWHRLKDTPGKLIDQELSISQWDWKDKVSTTNYYTPLFANILICYHIRQKESCIFSRSNLLFPDFCAIFYSTLAGIPDKNELDVKKLIHIFLEVKKLEFPLEKDTPQDACDNLLNNGLLLKKIPPEAECTTYEGTPDIVWIHKIATSLQKNWLNDECRITQGIKDGEWPDGKDLFQNIVSLVVQIAHSKAVGSAQNILTTNWKQLLEWGYYQAVIDSGFNCEPSLRNILIDILLNKTGVWKNHFDAIMRLCALGKVENDLLLRVVARCVEKYNSQTVTHGYLFANMLQTNISSLSWNEIIYAFSLLRDVRFEDNVPRVIGSLLGTALIEQAEKDDALHSAILQAREVSKKTSRKKYSRYPSDLYDWFCASVCDAVIGRYENDGYIEFCCAKWHFYEQSPDWNEKHRNKALTFALAAHYRYSLDTGNDAYTEWFEGFLEELKAGTKQEKTFALYSIVHTGLKEEGYNIRSLTFTRDISNNKLLTFARDILKHDSMRNLKNDPSVKLFMETNRIMQGRDRHTSTQ